MLKNYNIWKAASFLLIILLIALMAVGCTNDKPKTALDGSSAVKPEETQTAVKPHNTTVTLYFATTDGAALIAEKRQVEKNDHPARTALEELITGPRNTALVKVIPAATKIRNIHVVDHVAYVDFNEAFVKEHGGGSAGEIITVSAVVNTLTEFPEVKRVQFMVDGKYLNTLKGHLDLSEPVLRNESIIKK